MIPRYQTILFAVLLLASVGMSVLLWQLRERAHQRLLAGQDSAPTQAPEVAPTVPATLLVASDSDNSLLTQVQSLPLPQDPGSRARVVLGKLMDLYAAPDANHPVPGGASSIAQVFLLPAPNPELDSGQNPARSSSAPAAGNLPRAGFKPGEPAPAAPVPEGRSPQPTGPQLAVVNLTGAFVASHPSGLETETLTVLSICGTLHANLPRVTQVRFLVDGQPRATLAGHADLTRTYLAAEAVPTEGAHP
jgi:hypothetical protein